jgi:hypothetical protein
MPPVVYHHCLHTCLFNHLTTESQTYPLRSTPARTILMLAAGPTFIALVQNCWRADACLWVI